MDVTELPTPIDQQPSMSVDVPAVGATITVGVWVSDVDGVPVVQIDTTDNSGRIRVNVNEGPVFDADPEADDELRECAQCGDSVAVGLSSRDWCDGCEAEEEKAAERVAVVARYRKCLALRDVHRRQLDDAEDALTAAVDALSEHFPELAKS